jgi:hypothetical protein
MRWLVLFQRREIVLSRYDDSETRAAARYYSMNARPIGVDRHDNDVIAMEDMVAANLAYRSAKRSAGGVSIDL